MSALMWFAVILVILAIVVRAAIRQGRNRLKHPRRRIHEQANRWTHIRRGSVNGRTGRAAQVSTVYQRARHGTKAIIVWADNGHRQDAWFHEMHVTNGQWLLLSGSDGYGWHHQRSCHYVYPPNVLATAAPDAPYCFEQVRAERPCNRTT
ncbi:hypothetical protein [Saccharopolyspora spinosa]|uniref:Uncharacterized protein n=1 Tax=Saccharopolyspora spinosa TaxID=60894 RepID=A0A2N3Y3Y7_SACSN|nr:hypothetical protein [Saccharopolyspora spinosa]PKW17617.1 hypothetical protein A8926_5603 [Saccharopolyspora spinosa]